VLLFGLLTGLAVLGAVHAVRGLPEVRAVLLIPLLIYPLVYYMVPWQHRYRFPIEWILYLLAGAAVWTLVSRGSQALARRSTPSDCRAFVE